MKKYPKVSVATITYGHEKYITDTLDGILLQNYPGEIEFIIANDKSPDNTEKVISDYLTFKTIPQNVIIKSTTHELNKGMMQNFLWVLQQGSGKYVALCEGDDYWTDPLKLQKQVDFLEENETYSLIFSNANIVREDVVNKISTERDLYLLKESRQFSDIEILEDWMIPTASVLFRNPQNWDLFEKISSNKNFIFGDIVLFLYLSQQGKLWGMKDFLVTYRRQSDGVTQVKNHVEHNIKYQMHLQALIRNFGEHLRTKKIKKILSHSNMYTGLYFLKNGKVVDGLIKLGSSFYNDHHVILNYVKEKVFTRGVHTKGNIEM